MRLYKLPVLLDTPMRRALRAFLLIFAFLFAQAGLAAHAASHVAAENRSEQGLPADTGCELCVGYAQFAGGAPSPDAPALPVCVARHQAPDSFTAFFVSSSSFHSRTRAPPVFS